MNEGRSMRLIRELRRDLVTRWFEAVFGISYDVPVQMRHHPKRVVETTTLVAQRDEIESGLM